MTAPSDRTALVPAAGAGIALLGFGALLLLAAGTIAPDDPSAVELWVIGIGLLVLLGAILLMLVRSTPAPVGEGTPRAPDPPEDSSRVAAASSAPLDRPSAPDVDGAWADPRERRVPASSIPAQYVRTIPPTAAWAETPEPTNWDDADAVSLPFSAGPRGPELNLPPLPAYLDGPAPSVGELEMEVERLRERVHQLEATDPRGPGGVPEPVRPSLFLAGAPSEPPRPPTTSTRRACVGCGSGLPGGATDPLCWGCGRPLCATCYWRTKEGAAAHTCPSCFARTDGTSRSGARGPPPVTNPASSPPGRATATAPR